MKNNRVNSINQCANSVGIEAVKLESMLEEGFLWDPEDRLRAVKNNVLLNESNDTLFDVHHYIYDPNGTRLMNPSTKLRYPPSTKLRNRKKKPNGASTLRNSQQLGATQHVLDPYTVYVSGNYVVKFYDEYADVSKHYYAGGQRIASKLWQWHYNPTANPSQDPITPITPPAVQNNIVLEDLWDVITLWDSVLGTETPTLQELENMQLPTRAPFHKEPCTAFGDGYTGGEVNEDDEAAPPVSYNIPSLDHINCLCRNGENAFVWQNYGVSCHNFEELYFYHPDYLSNTEYVTDAGGYVYQYLFYSPFGESLYSQHAQTGEYNTPHRFNAKELDPETGNYYYGARYYNPRVSVWLSVDPLAGKFHSLTPYHFVANNPVMIFDPDGRDTVFLDNKARELYLEARTNVTTRISETTEKLNKSKPGKNKHERLKKELGDLNKLLDDFKAVEDKANPKVFYSTDVSELDPNVNGTTGRTDGKINVLLRPGHDEAVIHENRHVNQIFAVGENSFDYAQSHELDAYQYQNIYSPASVNKFIIESCKAQYHNRWADSLIDPKGWDEVKSKYTLKDAIRLNYNKNIKKDL